MKIEVKDSSLVIDLVSLLEDMDPESRAEIARQVGARFVLFKNVVEYLVTGSYNEDQNDGGWWFNEKDLAELRARVLSLLPEIQTAALTSAQENLVRAEHARRIALEARWDANKERDAAVMLLRISDSKLAVALRRLEAYEPDEVPYDE